MFILSLSEKIELIFFFLYEFEYCYFIICSEKKFVFDAVCGSQIDVTSCCLQTVAEKDIR